jgi:hypothetical protein
VEACEAAVRFGSEPIRAWRAWRIRYRDGLPESLQSVAQPLRWPSRKPMRALPLRLAQATILEPPCLRLPRPHTALRHTCGIYATRTPDQAREWSSHFGLDGRHQRVVGRVALWGRVLAHSGGWRAELAYPAAFEVPPQLRVGCQYPTQALAFWLEARYGVPVQIGGEAWARSRSGRAFARRRRSLGRVIGRLRP